MSKRKVFQFLEDLSRNNSKEWMDKNRSRYEEVKSILVEEFDPILERLKEFDPRIVQPTARKCLSRINNNLMFHPDRPTYKDHMGLAFGYGKGLADFYVHLGVSEQLIAGGLWHPSSEKLKLLRQEIDYEGERLDTLLKRPEFADHFIIYEEDMLKGTPKGYSSDHDHIYLLRMKSLAAYRPITREDFYSEAFSDMVVESYKAVVPLLDFANTAIQEA
ncbi:DUF2461 domain-containing protein [Roseivirga sp.]|uniref:DUF2461 domain-containing protein n=1 Tax=Roseivirga sp. TaxID=1964215 RepID=UPI003B527DB2